MANNGDHDGQREHWPKRPRISQISNGRSTNSEQNSPENQTADEQQLDQPGDADGFLQSSVNRGGIPQLTQRHLGQRGASNFIDQGREQPQELMQQQPDTSRGKKRQQQQSAPDSHSPEIRQTIAEDKLARKRQTDKKYRDRIRCEKQQTKSDLEKLRTENGRLNDERWELKSEVEKLKAENGQLKDERSELKSEVEKLKAENGHLSSYVGEIQTEIRSYEVELEAEIRPCEVELEAENRYSCSKNNDSHRSFTQGCGPPQSSTLGFQNVGPPVQPSTFNPFDDWSHDRDNGVGVYFTVEEIRIRSHEMLENEDMQHMLGLFSMGGHASMNMPEDGYAFPPYMPSPMPNFDENRSRPGKAVVGFLKIKAAMRWGFFIRKKAAERRAQIV